MKIFDQLQMKVIEKLVNTKLNESLDFDLILNTICTELMHFSSFEKHAFIKKLCSLYVLSFYTYLQNIIKSSVFEGLSDTSSDTSIGMCVFDCVSVVKLKNTRFYVVLPKGNEVENMLRISQAVKDLASSTKGSSFRLAGAGVQPWVENAKDILKVLSELKKKLEIKFEIGIKYDPNEYFDEKGYSPEAAKKPCTAKEMIDLLLKLKTEFPDLTYVEDLLHKSDIEGWKLMHILTKDKGLVVLGNNLFESKADILASLVEEAKVTETFEDRPEETKNSKKSNDKKKKSAEEERIEKELKEMINFPLRNWALEMEDAVTYVNILNCVKVLLNSEKRDCLILHDLNLDYQSKIVLEFGMKLNVDAVVVPFVQENSTLLEKFADFLD